MPLTYARYLKIDELLELQQPLSNDPEHDEMLFIITHQVYELWFKQITHELTDFQSSLNQQNLPTAMRNLKRVLHILKVLVAQMDIIETLSPVSFRAFRDRLENSSGFQSAQFREIEFILGRRNANVLVHYPKGEETRKRLEALLHQPSLWDSFLHNINASGYTVPESELRRDLTKPPELNEAVQQQLLKIYKNESLLTLLCEQMIDLDEGLQEWRYRHIKMVERTIGNKMGSGGSSGVDYLYQTLITPLFPDLWAIRNKL
ncbi:MAG: tryptophan 2,3-dioxygenase family protein [Gammaproteobacteria bacterium]|nr:tryptophan 2,3-dioxygenase family protein [Gammaproteobacteria bacterium]